MVTVTVSDPAGSEDDSIAVTIIVTDVVELGMVSGDPTGEYAENGMEAVATYAADGPVTAGWSVLGADMDDFDISNGGDAHLQGRHRTSRIPRTPTWTTYLHG